MFRQTERPDQGITTINPTVNNGVRFLHDVIVLEQEVPA